MQIRREQREALERSHQENRARQAVDRILAVLREEEDDFDQKISEHSRPEIEAFWRKVDALVNYEEDELELMRVYLHTRVDLFEHERFKPILEHPLLHDDAKARHLILAAKQWDEWKSRDPDQQHS
jgi:hypothetical protein